MNAFVRGVLEYFSTYALVLIPAAAVGAFFLTDFDQVTRDPIRLTIFSLLTFSATVLAVGHVLLLIHSRDPDKEDDDGKRPVWMIAFTYSKIAQSVAYLVVLVLVDLNLDNAPTHFETKSLHAVLAASAAASVLAALVFTVSYISGGFRHRIRLKPRLPWKRRE